MCPTMTTPITGGVGLLERAIGYTLGALHTVSPADLSVPTPCRDWNLRALLEHLADALAALHEAIDIGDVSLEPIPPDTDDPTQIVAGLRQRASQLLGAWANAGDEGVVLTIGGCPATGRLVTAVGAMEIVAHGWDVYRSVGSDHPIPTLLAIELLRIAPMLATDEDRPVRFAAPVAINPSAPSPERLIAYLGRDPHWPATSAGPWVPACGASEA